MRRGCQLIMFGEARGPVRDNLDDAQTDAERLKLGRFDQDGRFWVDAGVDFRWVPVPLATSAAA